ncbi:MAG: hypothetical protein VR67_13520 [Peptococcaceae bacterium BRH_c8a]|nr:MAG: hypothetical protein VR67_13520 [Peptococcaceae bacterium BRH_c8a]
MSVHENLQHIVSKIEAAARRSGRNPGDIKIIAVTKHVPADRIKKVLDTGIEDLGENRVQEMITKAEQLPPQARWHMIGHLQTNKVKGVVGRVELIHSLDRWKLAQEIDRQATEQDLIVPMLIQVNVSGEDTKFGINSSELMDFLVALQDLHHIKVKGLMTIAPYVDNPEETRPFFRELRLLGGRCNEKLPGSGLELLSMGMTNDFEVAVEEGANMLRLGTAIFGARRY